MTKPVESEDVFAKLLSFYCPLTAEVSPDAEAMLTGTLAWAERLDLGAGDPRLTKMLAVTGAVFTSHVYPHARGEIGQAFSDYSAWGWVGNEIAVSGRPARDVLALLGRWERILRSPNSWPEAIDPQEAALRDVLLRLRKLLTPVQWERFAAGQGQWLYQSAWEISLREQGVALSVNDYLATRIGAGAAYAAAAFVDAVEGIELSEREWAHPTVRAAAEASMLASVLDNDRYSYLHERRELSGKSDLFDVIRSKHPDLTLEEAVTEAVAIRDRIATLYLRLRDDILTWAGDDLHRYMTGLDRIISGNINFGSTAVRYLLPDSPHAVTRSDQPSDPRTDPLPYPTIAWWWEQLTP